MSENNNSEKTVNESLNTVCRPKPKPDEFFFLGWLVGIGFLLDLLANLGDPFEVLWFCSATSLLLTIGLFRKNALIISMVLLLAIPAQFFWIVDFFLTKFGHGLGRTAMLSFSGPLVYWSSLLLHALLIPVSAYGVWKLGFQKRCLLPSFLYFWLLLTLTFFLTTPETNHNCVFYPCDMADTGGKYEVYYAYSMISWTVIVYIIYIVMSALMGSRKQNIMQTVEKNG